jgi:hypothetical protein
MASRVPPFLRLAVLCQRVVRDSDQRSLGLMDPLHTISLTTERFGQPLTEMFLYAQLEDAVGSFEFSLRIEDEHRELVPQPNLQSVEHAFLGGEIDRIIPFELTLRLYGLVFPSPGLYYFILRADTQSLHQRDFSARAPLLRVLSE